MAIAILPTSCVPPRNLICVGIVFTFCVVVLFLLFSRLGFLCVCVGRGGEREV